MPKATETTEKKEVESYKTNLKDEDKILASFEKV